MKSNRSKRCCPVYLDRHQLLPPALLAVEDSHLEVPVNPLIPLALLLLLHGAQYAAREHPCAAVREDPEGGDHRGDAPAGRRRRRRNHLGGELEHHRRVGEVDVLERLLGLLVLREVERAMNDTWEKLEDLCELVVLPRLTPRPAATPLSPLCPSDISPRGEMVRNVRNPLRCCHKICPVLS